MVATRRGGAAATTSKLSRPAVSVKACGKATLSSQRSKPAAAAATPGKPATAAPRAPTVVATAGGRSWFEELYSGAMSEEYKAYMRTEWGAEKRGDQALFEKLSLEGAQAGLSWATILAKREAYRRAFHGFDVAKCAAMSDSDIDALLAAPGSGPDKVVRHRGKVTSVRNNARCVLRLAEEAAHAGGSAAAPPPHGHLDALLWSFVGGAPQLNAWPDAKSIPAETETGTRMSAELKRRGFSFVGPKICYSLMQSCGLVVDHPKGTPEWEAARRRLAR